MNLAAQQVAEPARGNPPGGRERSVGRQALWLTLAVALCYANSLQVPFLLDDPLPGVPLDFRTRPLVWATFALNRAVSGADTWSYHLFNALVHLGCGLLLLGVLRRTLASVAPALDAATRDGLAFATALLWLCHPLQTAAITYLSQRAEALAALFYLATLYTFLRYRETARERRWAALCLLALALGFATKEIVATAPLLLFLADVALLDGTPRANWRRHRGFFAALALVAGILALCFIVPLLGAEHASAGFGTHGSFGPLEYARSQPGVLLHYLRLAFWPYPLVFDYGWPIAAAPGDYLPQSALVLALLLASAWLLWRRSWLGFAGIGFFLILAPTSSIVPIKDLAFEHRLYLPLAALLFAALAGGAWLCARCAPALPFLPRALSLGVALALAAATAQRNEEYSSAIRLWRTVVERAPHNDRGYTNLGAALLDADRIDEAIPVLEEALRLDPKSSVALQNLGVAHNNRGDLVRSIECFERAVALEEDSARAHGYLARALVQRGDDAAAEVHLRRALELDARRVLERFELAQLLRRTQRSDEALRELETTLRDAPQHVEAHLALGELWLERGQGEEARRHFERALGRAPESAAAHLGLGRCLELLGRTDEALAEFRTANRLHPFLVESRAGAARLLNLRPAASAEERAEALRWAEEANRLTNPKRADVLETLALAQAALDEFEPAIGTLEQALALPGAREDAALAERLRTRLAQVRARAAR